jgi:hypothetical protein
MAQELTAARLRSLIDYDPVTGEFRWKPRMGRSGSWCNVDRQAGSVSKQTGYRTVRLDKKLYQAHRLAWLYVHGEWPSHDIDHINGERLDNRIVNLRDVPNVINRQNMRRARKDSSTGHLGVVADTRRGKFEARIKVDGVARHLGYFSSPEEAHATYVGAKRSLHPGCTI